MVVRDLPGDFEEHLHDGRQLIRTVRPGCEGQQARQGARCIFGGDGAFRLQCLVQDPEYPLIAVLIRPWFGFSSGSQPRQECADATRLRRRVEFAVLLGLEVLVQFERRCCHGGLVGWLASWRGYSIL